MKKRMALCVGMAVLTALWGCGAASAAENPSQALKGSGPAAEVSSAPGGAVSAAGASASSKSDGAYSVKPVSVEYRKDGIYLSAEFPQLKGNVPGNDPKTVYGEAVKNAHKYDGVNLQLEKQALDTICGIQVSGDANQVTSQTVGRVEFGSPDFVSAVFETSFKNPDNAHTFRALRTINYDLKADKAVGEKDLFVGNSDFYTAVDAAVKKQLPKEYQAYFTPDVIRDCIDKAGVYFRQDQIVVSLVTSLELNDHVEISIAYGDTAGFRTDKPGVGISCEKLSFSAGYSGATVRHAVSSAKN